MIVKNLTVKGFFENLSFTVNHNDKIAFLSQNSLVTTKLFEVLAGKQEADSGIFHWGKTATHTYLPQDNTDYFDGNTLSLVDWLRQYSNDQTEIYIRSWLGRMLFSGEEALKQVKVLSGGEKVRCMFAKMMLGSGNVLIFDEPTNHLDLESITALNKGMQAFRGNILFTSHDQELVQTVANRIIDIKSETEVVDKSVDFEQYSKLYM